MVELSCPSCGKTLRIPDEYRGQNGKCNRCGGVVHVTAATAMKPVPKWKIGCLNGCAAIALVFVVGSCAINTFAPKPPKTSLPAIHEAAEEQPAKPEYQQPKTVAPEINKGFSAAHENAVATAFAQSNITWPYKILPKFDGILFVEISLPNNGPENLSTIAKSLILTTRNAVYQTPGADPKWWYNIRFFGPPPGPGLLNLLGTCRMDHSGEITWEAGAQYTPTETNSDTQTRSHFSPQQRTTNDDTVYVASSGTKYHNQSCRTLKNGSTAVSLSAAKSSGYQACKVCRPRS